ncbi:acetate--CoA ligase family protein [Actinomadura livida]|uniref:Acetate--CoA ligase family protein n=1 Tax=Actinomadura livida TaxID=79909 RepID=A0A7W7IFB6_9ACTN|nr:MULTISPECIES: acetate--CoA ligase family protein [Actinomadura]MBB4776083.1 acyl-CoA synthetase (NDP forming) [Actinomadura catellatispora]GGU15616.1 pimeloyl-CoA synthetase [Actinomadura livida]
MTETATEPPAGLATLTPLVSPRSIAVVGASDHPARIGGRILARLKETYRGEIFPVNSSRATVQDLPAHPDVSALPSPVDLAIVAAPGPAVPQIARDAAARGTGALLVLSAGFGEVGGEGRRAQDELAAIGAASGMRICGPNCIGIMNLTIGLRGVFSTLTDVPQETGNIGIVSQSGGFGMGMFETAQQSGLGVSYVLATGNEADVTCGEMVGHLVEQPDVEVIALFMEGVRKPGALLAAARRALELGKPVVAVRTGRSRVGARAAASHTGALSSADDVVSAAFESAGIVRVDGPAELVEYARMFSAGRRPAGRRLAVVTSSGGAGVLMADIAESAGLEMPSPAGRLADELGGLVPSFGSIGNPIDPTAQIVNDQSMLRELFTKVTAAPDYDMVAVAGAARGLGAALRETLQAGAESTDKPFAVWAGQPDVARDLTARGVTTCHDPNLLVGAMGAMADYRENRERLLGEPFHPRADAVPDDAAPPRTLAEHVSRRYLADAGIPVPDERIVAGAAEAASAATELGGKVVLKLSAEWLSHKSEHGAVRVGLTGPAEIEAARAELAALGERLRPAGAPAAAILMQRMAEPGLELVCGLFTDPTFGPVLTVGLGGTLVEITRDRRLALAPAGPAEAARLVRGLAGGRLVGAARGLTEEQAASVAEVLVRLGEVARRHPEIRELELNPLIVGPSGAVAVDALAVVAGDGPC